MRAVEGFLREGTPLPGAVRSLPEPWRELALRAGLAARWRRHRGRVRHNLAGFTAGPACSEPGWLMAKLASSMARAVSLAAHRGGRDWLAAGDPGGDVLLHQATQALSAGRGLVVVSAHLGFWQLPLAAAARLAPTWLLEPSGRRVRLLLGGPTCPGASDRIGSRERDGWSTAMEALAQNQIVAALPDQPQRGDRWQPVSLLGRQVRLPSAAVELAALSGAPLLPVFCRLQAGHPHVACGTLSGPEAPTRLALQHVADAISDAVAAAPEQWLGWLLPWAEPARVRRSAPLVPARQRLVFAGA